MDPQDVPHLFKSTAHPKLFITCEFMEQASQDDTGTELSGPGNLDMQTRLVEEDNNNNVSENRILNQVCSQKYNNNEYIHFNNNEN